MFKTSDKITLTAIEAMNKKGEIITGYRISFPITNKDFYIPTDVVQLTIFEYHQEAHIHGNISFKICIGETTSIIEMCKSHKKSIKFINNIESTIYSQFEELCYYCDNDNCYNIFAKINEGDIVVSNINELRNVLMIISDNYKKIIDATTNIKNLTKKK